MMYGSGYQPQSGEMSFAQQQPQQPQPGSPQGLQGLGRQPLPPGAMQRGGGMRPPPMVPNQDAPPGSMQPMGSLQPLPTGTSDSAGADAQGQIANRAQLVGSLQRPPMPQSLGAGAPARPPMIGQGMPMRPPQAGMGPGQGQPQYSMGGFMPKPPMGLGGAPPRPMGGAMHQFSPLPQPVGSPAASGFGGKFGNGAT